MEKRNSNIDIIKFVAMLMVLLLHLGVAKDFSVHPYYHLIYPYFIGGIAVPLFFMVSGYLLANKDITYKYTLRKIFGVLRFCLIICVSYDIVNYLQHRNGFLWNFPRCLVQEGNFSVFWYFGAMILLYMIMPILFKLLKRYALWVFVISALISTFAYISDYFFQFEKLFIIQPLRLYYWIMYFSLGYLFRRGNLEQLKIFRFHLVVLSLVAFVFTGVYFGPHISNEYYFGTITCLIYAFLFFGCCLKLNVRNSWLIKKLSSLFLPVYSLHMLILPHIFKYNAIYNIELQLPIGVALVLEYIIVITIVCFICFLLMNIPYMKKIFSI